MAGFDVIEVGPCRENYLCAHGTPLMVTSDFLQSHDELRAALRVAAEEIRKLNVGRTDTPVLNCGACCGSGRARRRKKITEWDLIEGCPISILRTGL
jgi:hypothetical protein